MNKKEIISQGLLESYMTGELTPEQSSEVEHLILSDQEARAEYFKIEKLIELLAFHKRLVPSPVVKRMIMEDQSVMESYRGAPETRGNAWKFMMAASVLVASLSVFTAFYFFFQWQSTDEELSNLIAQNLELAENFNRVNNQLTDVQESVAVLISPEYQRIILEGTDNAPESKAVVYWNASQQKVFLNSSSLLSLPLNKQYQLWALVDGQPVDAGVFDAETGSFQVMKNVASADAFAVTVEPKGGSESPTLSTMQVLGKVEA